VRRRRKRGSRVSWSENRSPGRKSTLITWTKGGAEVTSPPYRRKEPERDGTETDKRQASLIVDRDGEAVMWLEKTTDLRKKKTSLQGDEEFLKEQYRRGVFFSDCHPQKKKIEEQSAGDIS